MEGQFEERTLSKKRQKKEKCKKEQRKVKAMHQELPAEIEEEDQDIRFFEFQRFLERKNETKFLEEKIHRDFNVAYHSETKAVKELLQKLNEAKKEVVDFLIKKEIFIYHYGEPTQTSMVMKKGFRDIEFTFKTYLNCFLGHVTFSDVDSLYGFHYWINTYLNELYETLAYDKVRG
jgi:hypothetical protein